MSQTGGLSTSIPRTAFSKRGSPAAVDFGSATVPAQDFPELLRYKIIKAHSLVRE